jgi:precorrin-6A/cobalt-precorrin-6A reductase
VPERWRILILGGSTEASALARHLAPLPGCEVVVSYAGRTRERVETPGEVRVGGFGGVDGLGRYLRDTGVDVLLDATHPFAAQMPFHAAAAGDATGVARLRVCRPAWTPVPGDRWRPVRDLDGAAAALGDLGARRVFLTTGRQELGPFAALTGVWFLVRAIEPPDPMPLPDARVVLARGPFAEADEVALLTDHRIDAVVSKNSGGTAAVAKLTAARRLGLPVVMVDRPPAPAGPVAATVDDALAWLAGVAPSLQAGASG